MKRYWYSSTIDGFLDTSAPTVVGVLASANEFALDTTQRDAWVEQVRILNVVLEPYRGRGAVYFEYSIPRLGRRIDAVVIVGAALFVLEFKVGETQIISSARDQVWDYALDLKNFHEESHHCVVAPILIATESRARGVKLVWSSRDDRTLEPLLCNAATLAEAMRRVLEEVERAPPRPTHPGPLPRGGEGDDFGAIDPSRWEQGRYAPTPTIIEAATALYSGHRVEEISRNDATAINLNRTSEAISRIIERSRERSEKAICFVTGVPGAGKTLVGLNIATQHIDPDSALYSVFLSGNGPLVAILREALARDRVRMDAEQGRRLKLGEARSQVKAFIQNVHHFRDDCLMDSVRPPIEHVALFDEAQRAWNLEQTAGFMKRKKGVRDFRQSEAEFLISCLDRHHDWAVIVCLVGGGQEINTGEAGISEWIDSLMRSFPHWRAYVSPRISDSEYAAGGSLDRLAAAASRTPCEELHLAVSMRSFRAEQVSALVKALLDLQREEAARLWSQVRERYPIRLTRDLSEAKSWLKRQARGSERYGVVASSEALRLKPHAVDVRSPMDPVHWFLDPKEDVRSSYYCEDVATEFHVQGLELDWACVTWDADFRHTRSGWEHWSFCGDRWKRMLKAERQRYLKNAYRVLLTRARQGMVIFVPHGEADDPTRAAEFYDETFEYLQGVGLPLIGAG